MTINVANILTLSRLVLAPLFVALFVMGSREPALIVFCIAGFTDLIDGTVARLLEQPSKGGALLDPLADKLLVESSFVMLLWSGLLPWWFFALALTRDVMIVFGIIYLERVKAEFPYRPTWSSKLATLLQLAVAVLGLFLWWQPGISFSGMEVAALHRAIIFAAALLIAISGVQYVILGLRILRKHKAKG
ncbi:MAG: CDP-alcohol phosphatidyltransferase family protein [Pseudomonadota bacterium]